jgi:hypothetical protein
VTKILQCKQCGEDVEVPMNRVSVVCQDCATKSLRRKDAVETLERCNRVLPNFEKPIEINSEFAPFIRTFDAILKSQVLRDKAEAEAELKRLA